MKHVTYIFTKNTFRKRCFIEKYYLKHDVFVNLFYYFIAHMSENMKKALDVEMGLNPIRDANSFVKQVISISLLII